MFHLWSPAVPVPAVREALERVFGSSRHAKILRVFLDKGEVTLADVGKSQGRGRGVERGLGEVLEQRDPPLHLGRERQGYFALKERRLEVLARGKDSRAVDPGEHVGVLASSIEDECKDGIQKNEECGLG